MASGGRLHTHLFTIEQIELIRRLRNSGITKEQVVQAFEELDRMELELGRNFMCAGSNGSSSLMPVTAATTNSTNTTTTNPNATTQQQQQSTAAAALINPFTYLQLQQHLLRQLSAAAQLKTNTVAAAAAATVNAGVQPVSNLDASADSSNLCSPSHNSVESPPATPQGPGGTMQHMSGGYLVNPPNHTLARLVNGHHDTFLEDQAELQDFMKQGDMANLDEIRKFVLRYNIKQHFIAEMAKISQAYVSRFFRGEVGEMSERTKTAIYSWYLTCKKNPWKLKQMCPNSGVKRMVSDSGDLIPLKRERFTFKSAHLAILERYYNLDPYPDTQTREMIVEECNRAMAKPDRELTDREKVTLNVVTNWFNNRRKEAKQKLKQQQGLQSLDLSQVLSQAAAVAAAGGVAWEHVQPPTQIVCQPDIDPSESDQSQDGIEAMKVEMPQVNLDGNGGGGHLHHHHHHHHHGSMDHGHDGLEDDGLMMNAMEAVIKEEHCG